MNDATTVFLAFALLAALPAASAAQTLQPPKKEGWKQFFGEVYSDAQGRQFRRGDTCRPPYTDKPGIVKVDGCGRWYCGRADIKDLIELLPNFAAEHKCKWTYRNNSCKCV